MMAADYRHIGGRENRLGRHYSRFSPFLPAPALASQSLALRKLCDAGSNRRRRVNPELGEPERQDQAGGTGADDQNVVVHHFVLRSSAALSPVAGLNRPRSAVWACWPASTLQIGRIC